MAVWSTVRSPLDRVVIRSLQDMAEPANKALSNGMVDVQQTTPTAELLSEHMFGPVYSLNDLEGEELKIMDSEAEGLAERPCVSGVK